MSDTVNVSLPANYAASLLIREGWTQSRSGAWRQPETGNPYWEVDEALAVALREMVDADARRAAGLALTRAILDALARIAEGGVALPSALEHDLEDLGLITTDDGPYATVTPAGHLALANRR
jgi:hypothetical protein